MTLSTAVRLGARRTIAFCLLALLVAALPARAQAPAANGQAAREAELQAAYEAGMQAGTRGPAKVALLDQAGLEVPADYLFVPKREAARMLRALGNTITESSLEGIVVGLKPTDGWIVVVRHIKEGYIKDDEAKDWNADELLQNLKDGNDESNKDRVTRGFPEVEIVGWIEKPTYDAATHRLVWSLSSRHKGEPGRTTQGINYNTYALGRDGYFSLNLLTNTERIGADKAVARTLLAALTYNEGKGYEDFNAATDHLAEYGIAALVGGIAAKKLGLLALIGVFVLKFAKIIAIGVAAFFAGVWKLFGRKREGA
jgi:uncharacterized membrane-anchored protein